MDSFSARENCTGLIAAGPFTSRINDVQWMNMEFYGLKTNLHINIKCSGFVVTLHILIFCALCDPPKAFYHLFFLWRAGSLFQSDCYYSQFSNNDTRPSECSRPPLHCRTL